MFSISLKNRLVQALLGVVLALSLWISFAWVVRQSTWAIFIKDSWPGMSFNTALCFLLLSVSRLILNFQRGRVSFLLNLFVFLISAGTLGQYAFDVNVGVEGFFVNPLSIALESPAAMALSTAVCFFLTSLTWIIHRRGFIFDLTAVFSTTLVLGFALIHLSSFYYGFNAEYGWGSYARMAFFSALFFIFLSLVFLIQLSVEVKGRYQVRSAFVPFQVLMAATFVTLLIWQLLVQRDQEANRRITAVQVESIKTNFDRGFDPLAKVLGHIARRYSMGSFATEKEWLLEAESYFIEFPFMRRIFLTNSEGLIKWAYPLDDAGQKILRHKVGWWNKGLRKHMDHLARGHGFSVSEVGDTPTGEKVFVFLSQSLRDKKYLGAIGAAIYAERFFEQTLVLKNYDVLIYEDGKVIYQKGKPEPAFAKFWKVNVNYGGMGVRWDIELVPQPSLIRANTSSLPLLVLVMGVVFSILLTLAVHFYLRKRSSEKVLQEVLVWKQASLNSTPLLFVSLDKNTIIREVNSATEQLLEYSAQELVGKVSPLMYFDLNEVREYQKKLEVEVGRPLTLGHEYMEALFERGYHKSSEWVLRSKSGKRYNMNISTSRITDAEGHTTGYLQILEDVTAIRERERILEEQERKLAISSRLASLGEMAAGIAHEINNPLAIINGHVSVLKKQLLAKGLEQEPEVKKRLETIETVIQRIAKIIKGLRSYVREPSAEALEEVSAESLIEDSLSYCQEKIDQNQVQLKLDLEKGLKVAVLPYQISQVILNLLNNAVDALQESTVRQIVVKTCLQKWGPEDGVEISVMDSGPGIPYALRAKIMEPFFTTKEVGKGVGLGLSICQGIIQGHQGKFYLDENSESTRFVIWLPFAKP